MLYVSKIENDMAFVTDTDDGVTDKVSVSSLFDITKTVPIKGVFGNGTAIPYKPVIVLLNNFNKMKLSDFIMALPMNEGFELKFRGKPRGSLNICNNHSVYINRSHDGTTYWTNIDGRRRYLPADYLIDELEWILKDSILRDFKVE